MVADPTAAQPYRAAFVSDPLPRTGRLSGTPDARLKVKLDKPTSNLTALLVDYGEDTRVNYLGAGAGIRTLGTEDCHGESTPADDACYKQTEVTTVTSPVNVVARGWLDAQNARSLSRPKALEPGRYYTVSWETLSQEYLLKKGHRLALVLAGTDADYNYEQPTGAQVTVDLRGTSITVPVVAAEDDPATMIAPPQRSTPWRGPAEVNLPVQERNLY
jgi:X-Pro dipeptidyl-peptidase